jgi:hypothetical protein
MTATLSIAQDAKAAEGTLDLLISKSGRGSKILIKDPSTPSHYSWHLWLPAHFNTSLDLRYIWRQQTKDKVVVRKWKEWAQGANFCFNEGSIIYDRDVSSLATWGDKLNAIDFYVVLGQTRPVSIRSGAASDAAEDASPGRAVRHPGFVNFRILVPTNDHRSIIASEHTVTQDQFVRYAISGSL